MSQSGLGRVFHRTWKRKDGIIAVSKFWSIGFPFKGRERVESTRSEIESVGWKLLRQRLEEIGRGGYVAGQQRVRFEALVELMRADYQRKGNRSWNDTVYRLKPLQGYFGGWLASQIDIEPISKYANMRLKEDGVSIATVNGEFRLLRRLFKLGLKHKKIAQAPIIELLEGENKRDDHIAVADFDRLLSYSRDEDVRDLVSFLYVSGWRVRSGKRLEKQDMDWNRETVKLREALSKNKEPMVLPFSQFPRLREILLMRKTKLRPDCKWIFHRNGKPILNFRKEWARMTQEAGFRGLTVHGLCRSAAVNLSRAGVPETVASKFMNRKTLSIYKQYRIVDSQDTELAGAALQSYYDAEKQKEKVVGIKRG